MNSPRRALITGAGSPTGIGFQSAKLLHADGYEVFLTGHSHRVMDRASELSQDGGRSEGFAADLTETSDREGLFHWLESRAPVLDVLVLNHGMTSVSAPASDSGESGDTEATSVEGFELSLSRNLTSAFATIKAVLPLIRRSEAGRIVVVSSVTGGTMAMRNEVSYAAAKAGLEGLVRAIAVDEASSGVTINAVAPGWIATDSQSPHEFQQGLKTPIGRSGSPAEIAEVIRFLASPGASYITGQVIVVDGGNSIAEERTNG